MSKETEDICSEWKTERDKHPFIVEGLNDQMIAECWDDSAETYSGEDHAKIREEILQDLINNGILRPYRTMLDIGCGPGLYERMFSPHVKDIFCIDGSERMIERLYAECGSNISNIRSAVCTWERFDTDEKYDIVFTSLCPPLNDPESILRMESYSSDICVYISSASRSGEISSELWRALGKDYSFGGYDTSFPYRFLRSVGRDPILKFYSEEKCIEMSAEEMISVQERTIGKYLKLDSDICDKIRSIIMSHASNSIVKEKRTVRLGMLIWNV